MTDVLFRTDRGHHCRIHRRWVDQGEKIKIPVGDARRRERAGVGEVVEEEAEADFSDAEERVMDRMEDAGLGMYGEEEGDEDEEEAVS